MCGGVSVCVCVWRVICERCTYSDCGAVQVLDKAERLREMNATLLPSLLRLSELV